MSLKFGSNITDRVTVAAKALFNDLSTFSVAMWFYPITIGTDHRHLFVRTQPALNNYYKRMYIASDGRIDLAVRRTTVSSASTAAGAVKTGIWQFVVATFNTTAGPNIYLGTETNPVKQVNIDSFPEAGAVQADASGDMFWGGAAGTLAGTAPFDGQVAAAGYWNRVLPLHEMRYLQNNFSPSPGCVNFIKFNRSGRVELQRDGTLTQTSNGGVSQFSNLIQFPSHKHWLEPPVGVQPHGLL